MAFFFALKIRSAKSTLTFVLQRRSSRARPLAGLVNYRLGNQTRSSIIKLKRRHAKTQPRAAAIKDTISQGSNQAVEEPQAQPAPGEAPSARGLLVGWGAAILALGVSSAIVGFGLWLVRLPLAKFVIDGALSARGVEADFQVVNLDFGSLTLSNLRIGPEETPDLTVASADAHWSWEGLSPKLEGVRLVGPRLRLRIGPGGQVSAGALDRWESSAGGGTRPQAPPFELDLIDGALILEAPFGELEARVAGAGVLGRDFQATAKIEQTSLGGREYALDRGGGEVLIVSRDNALTLELTAHAQALVWGGARLGGAGLRLNARTPLDLGRVQFEAAWRIQTARAENMGGEALTGAARGEATLREDALQIADWTGAIQANGARAAFGDAVARDAVLRASAEGVGVRAKVTWRLEAGRFSAPALIADNPIAQGELETNESGAAGSARINIARARLDEPAQRALRNAIPDIAGAPVGPPLQAAERALDLAADRFSIEAQFNIAIDADGARLSAAAPAQARAPSGALLRLAALRPDTSGLTLQWSRGGAGPNLQGAVAVDLCIIGKSL